MGHADEPRRYRSLAAPRPPLVVMPRRDGDEALSGNDTHREKQKPPQIPAEPGLREDLLLKGSGRSRTDDGGFAIGEPPPKFSEQTEDIATGRGVSRGNSLAGTFHDGNIETLAAKWHLLSDDMRTVIMAIFHSPQTTTPEADQS